MKPYVILFASSETIANLAKRAWIYGVLWSVFTVILALAFVGIGKGSLKWIGR